jgi:hypothetical protein
MSFKRSTLSLSAISAGLFFAACASQSPTRPVFDQSSLPASIQVPAGNNIAMETVGVGEIT